jgi:hypothetical protein
VCLALEVAEHDRPAIRLRQAGDLVVEDRPNVAPQHVRRAVGRRDVGQRGAVNRRAPRPSAGPAGDPIRHLVEPARDGLPFADGTGPARQDEERGLKGVLGILFLTQDAAAEVEHHRAVPPHQQLERRLVAPTGKAVKQIRIRNLARSEQAVQTLQDDCEGTIRHKSLGHQTTRHPS